MATNDVLRLAIDGNEANITHRVGSNVYAFEILQSLERLCLTQKIQVTVLLAAKPIIELPKARSGWQYQVLTPTFLWTQITAPLHLFLHQNSYDVFFTPGHYAPRLCKIPYISTVMDLAFLKYPDQFKQKDLIQLKDWTAYSVAGAQKVIAISEFTKQDILKNYQKTADQIVVAYPSSTATREDLSRAEIKEITTKLGITQPYLLYVGTLQPRKNLIRVIEAFERLHRLISQPYQSAKLRSKFKLKNINEFDDVQLVLAGKVGWLADEILAKVDKSPLKNNIILTGFVGEKIKNALYQGSNGSILVGLYEGFGIPPLESLAQGTVPVVSKTTSLPEVVGEAGIQVNPENVASIADGLLSVLLLSAQERGRLRREGRRQLQKFSWADSAQKILDALKLVAKT